MKPWLVSADILGMSAAVFKAVMEPQSRLPWALCAVWALGALLRDLTSDS